MFCICNQESVIEANIHVQNFTLIFLNNSSITMFFIITGISVLNFPHIFYCGMVISHFIH